MVAGAVQIMMKGKFENELKSASDDEESNRKHETLI